MNYPQRLRVLSCLLLPLLSFPVFGQTPPNQNTQIQTQEFLKNNAFAPTKSVEEQAWENEFGRIVELERVKPWSITPYSSTLGFWTTNARLARANESSDAVLVQREGVDFVYHIDENWHLGVDYRFEIIRYHRNTNLDTNSSLPEVYVSRRLPWNWNVTIGDRETWLDFRHSNTAQYRENSPYLLATQFHAYLDSHLYWFYGFQYDHRFTHPSSFNRNEYQVFTGATHDWTPQLVSQLMLSQDWQPYDSRGQAQSLNRRQEWISNGTLLTIWRPLPWLQLTGFVAAAYDNSINGVFDYKVVNLGAEIRLFWKF
jgi:hypothetical protein